MKVAYRLISALIVSFVSASAAIAAGHAPILAQLEPPSTESAKPAEVPSTAAPLSKRNRVTLNCPLLVARQSGVILGSPICALMRSGLFWIIAWMLRISVSSSSSTAVMGAASPLVAVFTSDASCSSINILLS